MDNYEKDYETIENWVNKEVIPVIKKENMQLLFIKNARFSNKFNATTCFVNKETLVHGVVNINYASLCVGANGISELIIRDRIRHNIQVTPCIYNGLPLRTEFRVFYDFDTHKVLYTANYWDYNYVYPHLYDLTDKIVFDYTHEKLDKTFNNTKDEVERLVSNSFKTNTSLEGRWSVDILLEEDGTFWLIDMATAEMSTYWKPELLKE